jgi:hypothetical protein
MGYGDAKEVGWSFLGYTRRIAASHKTRACAADSSNQENDMTHLTLRPTDAPGMLLASLAQLVRELFSATPLGIVLAIRNAKR